MTELISIITAQLFSASTQASYFIVAVNRIQSPRRGLFSISFSITSMPVIHIQLMKPSALNPFFKAPQLVLPHLWSLHTHCKI